jgi:diguanylate cyclase (GGDEF)-like protein
MLYVGVRADYARRVTRLLQTGLLLVSVAFLGLALAEPSLLPSQIGPGRLVLVSAVAALVAGAMATTIVGAGIRRWRFRGLIAAAERLAAGDLDVRVDERGGGVEGRLADALHGISQTLVETHAAASVDKLTGVSNRQALLAELFSEVERSSRYNRPFSVAFVDIDHFKQVNDTYGHAVGDVVLRGVAQTVRANLRATDTIGRYGGEEFLLLLAETSVDDAALLAEKIRGLVQRERFHVEGDTRLSVTVSIGIAGGQGQTLRVDELVRDADGAMYSAKSLGRNQTYVFAEPDDDARVPRAPISTAGRNRAQEIGRAARDAAQAALTSYIAPLPHYRGQPSALIATIVVELASRLGLPEAEVDKIRVAALLHDVGKVGIPEDILEKPSALTSAEWRTVVQHPRIGQVILEQASALREAVPIILHHHERFSGHGYPYGLRGTDIPIGARIVAIADAYDAMTHDRPYKRAMNHDSAIRELRRHAGTQFDPELVSLFCDLYTTNAPEVDPTIALIAGLQGSGGNAVQLGDGRLLADGRPNPPVVPVQRRRRRVPEEAPTAETTAHDGPRSATG